jgi:hypothetical protein
VLGSAATLVAVAAAAACTGNPNVQLDAGTGAPSGPPFTAQTVTVTATVTTTVTASPSTTAPPTTVPPTTRPPTGPTLLPTAPTLPDRFDEGAARAAITALISGIGRLDHEFAQPAGAPSSLTSVEGALAALLGAGVPTGTDGPSYVARILSLQVFVSAVRAEAGGNRAQAVARYAVVRQETGVLLGQLNVALHATYVLPAPPASSPTPSTTPTP